MTSAMDPRGSIPEWDIPADARERGMSHRLVVPCLLVTFTFGPVGLLLYLGVRVVHAKGRAAT